MYHQGCDHILSRSDIEVMYQHLKMSILIKTNYIKLRINGHTAKDGILGS